MEIYHELIEDRYYYDKNTRPIHCFSTVLLECYEYFSSIFLLGHPEFERLNKNQHQDIMLRVESIDREMRFSTGHQLILGEQEQIQMSATTYCKQKLIKFSFGFIIFWLVVSGN